jgi:hypothetical protein
MARPTFPNYQAKTAILDEQVLKSYPGFLPYDKKGFCEHNIPWIAITSLPLRALSRIIYTLCLLRNFLTASGFVTQWNRQLLAFRFTKSKNCFRQNSNRSRFQVGLLILNPPDITSFSEILQLRALVSNQNPTSDRNAHNKSVPSKIGEPTLFE